jgi:acetyl-CoA/propionyl-CoA carboxylase biotin carboxyl carrier protein
VDAGVESLSTVPGTFDSLMAKLIVTGATRQQAIARARRALREFRIEGVASVLPFHRAVMEHPDFVSEEPFKVHTRWIETDFANTLATAARAEPAPDASLYRTAMEIDGRRVALGLPAELLRGLQSLGGGANMTAASPAAAAKDVGAVISPISGTLQSWTVADGSEVQQGDVVAVMDAMKMEMHVSAHRSGRITLNAPEGSYQILEAVLASIE